MNIDQQNKLYERHYESGNWDAMLERFSTLLHKEKLVGVWGNVYHHIYILPKNSKLTAEQLREKYPANLFTEGSIGDIKSLLCNIEIGMKMMQTNYKRGFYAA